MDASAIKVSPADSRKTVEEHAMACGMKPFFWAACKAFHRWAIGQEMSESEFKAAVSRVLSEPYGYRNAGIQPRSV